MTKAFTSTIQHLLKLVSLTIVICGNVFWIGSALAQGNTSPTGAATPQAATDSTTSSGGGENKSTPAKGTPMQTFNVGQYLTTQGGTISNIQGEQNQSYLCNKRDKNGKCTEPSVNPIASFLIQVINFMVLTVSSVFFFVTVYGGFLVLTAMNNANGLSKGKDVITHGAIGLVITLSAYFIIAFVQNILFERL